MQIQNLENSFCNRVRETTKREKSKFRPKHEDSQQEEQSTFVNNRKYPKSEQVKELPEMASIPIVKAEQSLKYHAKMYNTAFENAK